MHRQCYNRWDNQVNTPFTNSPFSIQPVPYLHKRSSPIRSNMTQRCNWSKKTHLRHYTTRRVEHAAGRTEDHRSFVKRIWIAMSSCAARTCPYKMEKCCKTTYRWRISPWRPRWARWCSDWTTSWCNPLFRSSGSTQHCCLTPRDNATNR